MELNPGYFNAQLYSRIIIMQMFRNIVYISFGTICEIATISFLLLQMARSLMMLAAFLFLEMDWNWDRKRVQDIMVPFWK